MSQENVEVVRAAFAAWNAGDMEALLADVHPELVYHPRADEPDPSPHVGRDAFERLVYGFLESFSEYMTARRHDVAWPKRSTD
jgi:ketosteroid isomerase-like protein